MPQSGSEEIAVSQLSFAQQLSRKCAERSDTGCSKHSTRRAYNVGPVGLTLNSVARWEVLVLFQPTLTTLLMGVATAVFPPLAVGLFV